jgi:hypothetical protein
MWVLYERALLVLLVAGVVLAENGVFLIPGPRWPRDVLFLWFVSNLVTTLIKIQELL